MQKRFPQPVLLIETKSSDMGGFSGKFHNIYKKNDQKIEIWKFPRAITFAARKFGCMRANEFLITPSTN